MDIKASLKRLAEIDKELSLLLGINNLLDWDKAVIMPDKAASERADQMALINSRIHEISKSPELIGLIDELSKNSQLDMFQRAIVDAYAWKISRIRNIPKEHVEEFSRLVGIAEKRWEEAKQNSDFETFRPYLERIFAMKIKEAGYIDPKAHPYECILQSFEKGITLKVLDENFKILRDGIIEILNKIKLSKNHKDNIIKLDLDYDGQVSASRDIATRMLEDKDRFTMSKSVHPFEVIISPNDSRVTTAFVDNPMFSFTSTVHESGHALYESSYAPNTRFTILFDAPTFGMHESQSRFWENQIIKSESFWKFYYPIYKGFFPKLKMPMNKFYRFINHVQPTLIRTESDELTYCLHIIIRYEIEKSLFEGKIAVKDLPKIWNDKYFEYLGIRPQNDAEGILQDMHWSVGQPGYFPSYAIGNIYAAMIYNAIRKKYPDFDKRLESGDTQFIKDWLKENIHKYGASMSTSDIIKKACGKDMDVQDLLQYYKDKFYKMYGVKE